MEDYVSESDLFGEEGDGEEASDLDNSEMGDNASEMGEETGMESEMGENGADGGYGQGRRRRRRRLRRRRNGVSVVLSAERVRENMRE